MVYPSSDKYDISVQPNVSSNNERKGKYWILSISNRVFKPIIKKFLATARKNVMTLHVYINGDSQPMMNRKEMKNHLIFQ